MNPLDQLEPLIAPAPVAWWPPAPGWWLLAVLVLVFAWLSWRRAGRSRPGTPDAMSAETSDIDPVRQAALDELAGLPAPYGENAGPWLQHLNGLLKRLCKARYPEQRSQTLSGRAWLAYLDSRCPAAGLTRWMILVDGAYRSECRLDDRAIDELSHAIEIWIRKHV